MTTTAAYEQTPDLIIDAPQGFEHTHTLAECAFCHTPNPYIDCVIPVREFAYFDIVIGFCEGPAKHIFTIKHEIGFNASHLKVWDRTRAWERSRPQRSNELRMQEELEELSKTDG
jgi:hypothetical protein